MTTQASATITDTTTTTTTNTDTDTPTKKLSNVMKAGVKTLLSIEKVAGFSHPIFAKHQLEDGTIVLWNARAHRKQRHQHHHAHDAASGLCCPIYWWRYQPLSVTFWIVWIGFVANSLWVINGVFATWPQLLYDIETSTRISYATGIVGAFLFMVTAYLGIVEVINHNASEIPDISASSNGNNDNCPDNVQLQTFQPTTKAYGQSKSPLGDDHHVWNQQEYRQLLRSKGYPLILCTDSEGQHLLTSDEIETMMETDMPSDGDHTIDIVLGNLVVEAKITSIIELKSQGNDSDNGQEKSKIIKQSYFEAIPESSSRYQWWTNQPDFSHISVFNAYLFMGCTILFFIPACAWYPLDENPDTPLAVNLIVVDCLQIIPSVGFIFVGHIGMAEATGSWCYTLNISRQNIGYWISFFNALGGWGFMLCGIFLIPVTVAPDSVPESVTVWGSSLSTFWGSCFFWIAGVLQIIEFATPHPIQKKVNMEETDDM